jgi:hypothetical protein
MSTQTHDNQQTVSSKKPIPAWMRFLFGGWIQAFRDIYNGLVIPFQELESAAKTGILLLVSVVVTWFVYVPIHELLHVAGCVVTGGTVTELIMGREYGADFLARFFPFITPQSGQYAGRVTGFEPNGDVGYFVTVFAPYILTLFPGIWLVGHAAYTRKFWLFGPGIVVGLAGFYNLTGDYFEMGTILSTRIVDLISGGNASASINAFWEMRSDDLFHLISEISETPANYGMTTGGGIATTLTVIVSGLILAVWLAGVTYIAGRYLSKHIGSSTIFAESDTYPTRN